MGKFTAITTITLALQVVGTHLNPLALKLRVVRAMGISTQVATIAFTPLVVSAHFDLR
jgi:hypothetical protein